MYEFLVTLAKNGVQWTDVRYTNYGTIAVSIYGKDGAYVGIDFTENGDIICTLGGSTDSWNAKDFRAIDNIKAIKAFLGNNH